MRNYCILIIGVVTLLFADGFILAQTEDPFTDITFPVSELGNCGTRAECEKYCDLPENMSACLDFAEVHNLLPALEIKMARDMLRLGETAGPGGCQGYIECAAYCDEISHIEKCITFAEEHGLIPPEELENAKKVIAAMEKGLTPPNCKSKSQCDVYCQEPEHMEECITFGEAAGLIPPEELGDAKKALQAVKKGVKLPRCMGKVECDAYCAEPEHFEECINFAEAAGFMTPEEAEQAKKGMERQQMQPLEGMPPGGLPPEGMPPEGGFPPGFEGKCASPEECVQYCLQNLQDPACQAMIPTLPEIPPVLPLEEMTPPPSPPTETLPQSLFDQAKNFLANLLLTFGF